MTTQSDKARLGAIGESMVVTQLMALGWDAFNANCTIKNFKTIDIVCIDGDSLDPKAPWRPNISLVQVKTSFQTNIPIGFTIGQCLDKEYLEKNVMGPYVFVSVKKNIDKSLSFDFYIISRSDFINLAYESHKFYVYGYTREIKPGVNDGSDFANGIKLSSPAGFYIKWLEGVSEPATKNHIIFHNPLQERSCKMEWGNIWLP